MKSTRTAIFVAGCMLLGVASAFAQNVRVIQEVKHDVSLPLREMAKLTPIEHNTVPRLIPLLRGPAGAPLVSNVPDPIAQQQYLPAASITSLLNFDGQNADNLAPPDTEGSVGATQYVQWVNVEYNVYDKTTGAKTLGPIAGSAFWAGFGGTCQTTNSGDPIIIYDKAAQRWFVAQNVFSAPYMACVAVSTTSDITGTFNRYAFKYNSTDFPDYPKWGVWSDAYYQSFNDFLNGFSLVGSWVCAADRAKMLSGSTATLQCITVKNQTGMLPSDLDGSTPPPAGAPDYYVNLGNTTNTVNFWQFHVDFVNPTNTTFTGPTPVTVSTFSEICGNGTNRSCVPQPSPGEMLDSLGDRMMYRAAYRNFGDHEAIVAAHTVKPGTGSTAVAATRWYEFRSPATPTVFQSGTYQNAKISLWMPSIAMDKAGDIALGMSAASSTTDPSVVYAVRTPTNPLGKLSAPTVVVKGTGVQQSTSNRWGDYSDMQIDPVDDCTFWYTQEYIKTTGSFNWSTRINSFKFTTCQ